MLLQTRQYVIRALNIAKVYYWTTIRKNRSKYNPTRGIGEEAVTSILLHDVIVAKDVSKAEAALLELPGLKKYFSNLGAPRHQDKFKKHMRSYINIWQCDCPFDVSTTNRYTIVTHEAAITARRHIRKGETIKYLVGNLMAMTVEEAEDLDLTRRDFSVVMSSRKKTPSLFLGPARFANHDCKANARLVHRGSDGMYVIAAQDIAVGKEITVDYGNHYFGENNDECLCKTCEIYQRGGWSGKDRAASSNESDSESDESSSVRDSSEEDGIPSAGSSFTTVDPDSEDMDESPSKRQKLNNGQVGPLSAGVGASEVMTTSSRSTRSNLRSPQNPSIEDVVDHETTDLQSATIDGRHGTPDGTIIGLRSIGKRTSNAAQLPGLHLDESSFSRSSSPVSASDQEQLYQSPEEASKRNALLSKMRSLIYARKPDVDSAREVEEAEPINWEVCGKVSCPIHRRYLGLDPDYEESHLEAASGFDEDLWAIERPSSTSLVANDTVVFPVPAARGRPRKKPAPNQYNLVYEPGPQVAKPEKPRTPRRKRVIQTFFEIEIPSIRKPGDYIRTALLLGDPTARWVTCRTCDEVWVQANGYQTRKECPRCERHSKLYGYQWPKTDKAGKNDDEERVMDHRTVHRFLPPDEEKEEKKKGRGLVIEEAVAADESDGEDVEDGEPSGSTDSRSRGERRMRVVQRVTYTR